MLLDDVLLAQRNFVQNVVHADVCGGGEHGHDVVVLILVEAQERQPTRDFDIDVEIGFVDAPSAGTNRKVLSSTMTSRIATHSSCWCTVTLVETTGFTRTIF